MLRTALLGAIVLAVIAVVLLLGSGFPDIPCQDGQWSEAKQTCIPD